MVPDSDMLPNTSVSSCISKQTFQRRPLHLMQLRGNKSLHLCFACTSAMHAVSQFALSTPCKSLLQWRDQGQKCSPLTTDRLHLWNVMGRQKRWSTVVVNCRCRCGCTGAMPGGLAVLLPQKALLRQPPAATVAHLHH